MNDFEAFHLTSSASVNTPLPGPESKKLLALQTEMEGSIVSYPRNLPIAIKRAKGAIIEDEDGNYFIDFFAGAGVVNLGHCNEEILEAVRFQQDRLVHALDFPTRNKAELINKMRLELPDEMRDNYKVSFCSPSGSDAVEAAIKLAKIHTGRTSVIAFHGSYHGMSSGALAVTSNIGFRKKLSSLVPDVHFVPYSYCYRCQFNKQADSCSLDCASYLRSILTNNHSGITKPAAIILEPLQGEGGNILPKSGFLEEVMTIARENGILVIFDEIQCGFYRTGTFIETLHTDLQPDIILMSKGLGGVGFPISAIIYRKEIESWKSADHIGTFRGNQVSIAAGNRAIEFANKYQIKSHVEKISSYLFSSLEKVFEPYPFVGEIRGRGLMIGIEVVKDKVTKEPFPAMARELRSQCFARGLLFEIGGHYDNVIRLVPPLIINKAIVDNAIEIFEKALIEVDVPQAINSLVKG